MTRDIFLHPGWQRSDFVNATLYAVSIFVLVLASSTAPSFAQKLPTLNVLTLTLSSDTAHPLLERPFHLVVSARFKERALNPDEFIILPALGGLQILGDERHASHASKRTDYVETLTVVAHAAGAIHVGAAYFDAIDARSGKPARFSSNELSLVARSGALGDPLAVVRHLVATLAKIALVGLLVFGATLAARRAFALQSRKDSAPPSIATHIEAPTNSNSPNLRAALEALQTRRNRLEVLNTRYALWQTAGANGGETLNDLLRRSSSLDGVLTSALRATERASFIADAHLPQAIDDMIPSLERVCGAHDEAPQH